MEDVGIQITAPCWLTKGDIGEDAVLAIYRDLNLFDRRGQVDGHSDITRI